MSVPQPIDNEKYQFVTTNKEAEPTNKKVVELKSRQNPENMSYLVNCSLAAEVISYWLEGKEYPRSPIEALNLLGIWVEESQETSLSSRGNLEVGEAGRFELLSCLQKSESEQIGSLFKKLEIIFAHLGQKYNELLKQEGLTSFFECIEKAVDAWYKGEADSGFKPSCAASLKNNAETWRAKLIEKFEELVFLENQSSVGGNLAFLSEMSLFLTELEREYAQQRARNLEKSDSCNRAYQRALLGENFNIAKKSMVNCYKFKIAAEVYSNAASILNKLESNNENYLDYYKTSQGFLAEIKADFFAQIVGRDKDCLLPFWVENSLRDYINLERLREQVEKRLGRTLPIWGSINYKGIREISALEVKDVLLEELTPIAEQICSNAYNRLKKEYS